MKDLMFAVKCALFFVVLKVIILLRNSALFLLRSGEKRWAIPTYSSLELLVGSNIWGNQWGLQSILIININKIHKNIMNS